jgi:hypothetical protein
MKTKNKLADSAGQMPRLVLKSFPSYGVAVSATTMDGETGIWSHGQYGWYPQGKWGIREHPHAYIAEWKSLPNV